MGASSHDEPIDLKPLCDAIKAGEIDAPTRASDTVVLSGMDRPATLAEFTRFIESLGLRRHPSAADR